MGELQAGEIQAVVSMAKNTERDAYATYSVPLIKSDMIYAATNDKPDISGAAGLKGWTIGAVAGSNSAQIANKTAKEAGEGTKVAEDSDSDSIIKKVSAGRYGDKGAIIMNEDVLAYLTKKNSVNNLKKILVAKSDLWGIYFSKKAVDQASIDKFNAAIEQLKKNGELEKIIKKYNIKN